MNIVKFQENVECHPIITLIQKSNLQGLRITPFQYYIMVLENIMAQEKSYDSLPNFTAVDCLRSVLSLANEHYCSHDWSLLSPGCWVSGGISTLS